MQPSTCATTSSNASAIKINVNKNLEFEKWLNFQMNMVLAVDTKLKKRVNTHAKKLTKLSGFQKKTEPVP